MQWVAKMFAKTFAVDKLISFIFMFSDEQDNPA